MNAYNQKAIEEAAYFIWKNSGCPANSSLQNWNAAVDQIATMEALDLAKVLRKSIAKSKNINPYAAMLASRRKKK